MTGGRRIEIRGTVQGVGFRPWVYRVARAVGLGGRVRNQPEGVSIEAFGEEEKLDAFLAALARDLPPAARVHSVDWVAIPAEGTAEFVILPSADAGERRLSIPADLATCPACAAEIADPANRRFGYAFTNCTECGPRFTIATGVPYDRAATTMAWFTMCPACAAEYRDPLDRRFHAQPNACPDCGPHLGLVDRDGRRVRFGPPLAAAADLLQAGEIVAVKGLGGFHLACDASSSDAVERLRLRKRREAKPLAVMVARLEDARDLGRLTREEEALLTSPVRPIVLCERRPGAAIAPEVAPDTSLLGLFLPYTPLHHLLLAAARRPLVMTSGNRSDEPIARSEEEALARLGGIASAFVVHDREIANRCDDSVVRVIDGAPVVLRRSRGYVPYPIRLARPVARPVLACGAHFKNTFCLARGDSAWLGQHIGDLETPEAYDFLAEAIARMEALLDLEPEVVAHDLHPDYLSTRYAEARPEPVKIAVQHHHAHIASAMAEHGLAGPVLGLAYDGTGFGPDGAAWGGELLVADLAGYRRLATFRPLPLAGGEAAIRQVWRVALAALDDAFSGDPPLDRLPLFRSAPAREIRLVRELIARGVGAPPAHGVGRWFDAAGAFLLDRPHAHYEGQVAMALDAAAGGAAGEPYGFAIEADREPWQIDLRAAIRAAALDRIAGRPVAAIAARFHGTLIAASAEVVRRAAELTGRLPVVLSGGAFQNSLLASGIRRALEPDLAVHVHREVPPGDGGIALGQAVVAAEVTERRASCA
ncbi:MAG TPA: carbamoyltransferase HypF [Kofleriaceae bacterium]|nr:carbamoyltransferase HypF [Kofleriaceae bacterium]